MAHSKKTREKLGEITRRKSLERLAQLDTTAITQKRCTRCGKLKPVAQFRTLKEKLKCGLIAVRPEPRCRACKSEVWEEWKAKKEAEGVDLNERKREHYARRTDAQKRREREKRREWAAARRRKDGKAVGTTRTKLVGGPCLSAEPLREFLQPRLAKDGPAVISRRTGVTERRIYEIKEGLIETVHLSTADAIFTGLNCPEEMIRLYPGEVEEPLVGYHVLDPEGILNGK